MNELIKFIYGKCCLFKKYIYLWQESVVLKKKFFFNLFVARECCHSPQTTEATFYTKVCK